ncbi:N-acetylmuramoyl-L-alanine amidase family protein [Rossellomorea aquimaris]|uniref:N-acetylmuramoyl-L-alanine amidase family protein n=1 Tax=Rossellomorea aquimaris TaxID=189382 RepID=UPI003CF709A3
MRKALDYLIALDDGHGIGTPGKRTPYIKSLGRQIRENEFNEAVTLYLKEELERCGFRTLLTAPTDYDTPLTMRTNLANSMGADILVSNHFNALDGEFDGPGKDPEGMSIHIYPGAKNGRKLAEHVAKYLKQGTKQKYRGIVEQNLHMTREFNRAAILVENGFMDNEREALLMINKEYQSECAREQAQGICDYFGIPYVLVDGKEPVKTVKPPRKEVKGEYVVSNVVGKRVESIYRGSEGLDFYRKPTFNNRYLAGNLKFGYGFPTIVRKLKVEGAYMYEVKNSHGYKYYLTAADEYVKVEGTKSKKVSQAKTTGNSKSSPNAIGEIKIVNVNSAVIIQDRPDRKLSKNIGTISKGKTIQVTGSVRGKNSSSGYWEVNFQGGLGYITGKFGEYHKIT